MATTTNEKKRPESEALVAKVLELVNKEFADFERFMPTPQDKAMMKRKFSEYSGNVMYKALEELNNGRANDTAAVN